MFDGVGTFDYKWYLRHFDINEIIKHYNLQSRDRKFYRIHVILIPCGNIAPLPALVFRTQNDLASISNEHSNQVYMKDVINYSRHDYPQVDCTLFLVFSDNGDLILIKDDQLTQNNTRIKEDLYKLFNISRKYGYCAYSLDSTKYELEKIGIVYQLKQTLTAQYKNNYSTTVNVVEDRTRKNLNQESNEDTIPSEIKTAIDTYCDDYKIYIDHKENFHTRDLQNEKW